MPHVVPVIDRGACATSGGRADQADSSLARAPRRASGPSARSAELEEASDAQRGRRLAYPGEIAAHSRAIAPSAAAGRAARGAEDSKRAAPSGQRASMRKCSIKTMMAEKRRPGREGAGAGRNAASAGRVKPRQSQRKKKDEKKPGGRPRSQGRPSWRRAGPRTRPSAEPSRRAATRSRVGRLCADPRVTAGPTTGQVRDGGACRERDARRVGAEHHGRGTWAHKMSVKASR